MSSRKKTGMFDELNKIKIKVHDSDEKILQYIPNVISMHPLDELFKATQWLFDEAVKDHNETHKEWDEHPNEHQRNIDAIDDLGTRLGSRTQGYVNQLCLMEDILVYEYDRMSELLNKASGGKITFKPSDYEPLQKRFASIRTFRNKVVAHTAYTYPKIDKKTGLSVDNPETIVRSILNLFPSPTGITLGANFYSGFSPYRSELPVITIFNWEEEMKSLFYDWKTLFARKMLETLNQRPLKNGRYSIETASPHLIKAFSEKFGM